MYNCSVKALNYLLKKKKILKGGGGQKGMGGDKVNKKHLYNLFPTGVMKFIIGL